MNKPQHSDDSNSTQTHFGYQQVPTHEKVKKVRSVFDSVASKYDLMNDLMSFGIHRLWKRFLTEYTAVRPGYQVLDIAGGTGDISRLLHDRVGESGCVTMLDINAAMLSQGRDRFINQGVLTGIDYIQANAEHLPFNDNSFDLVTIAFGLRNVTDKQQALDEMTRVLKPGKALYVLEFSRPTSSLLNRVYDTYSFKLLPKIGEVVAKDAESYQYLAESIRMHPDQDTLKGMFQASGLELCEYTNLTGGIVAIHRGFKPEAETVQWDNELEESQENQHVGNGG